MRFLTPLLLLAPIAQAGEFTPPKGCTAYLTVQSRSCAVSHHWTCEDDTQGDQWSAELDANGTVYLGQIDYETQWLATYYSATAFDEETLIQPANDPASLTELLETGTDTYDFQIKTNNGVQSFTGVDRIAERDVMIDGERLHRTSFEIRATAEDGTIVYLGAGSDYVSETHRHFFSGAGWFSESEKPVDFNQTPMEFIYPGETGFLSDEPKYDCAVVTARHVIEKKDTKP